MSGAPPSGLKSGKTMSSRLLTMKFMQRATASAATNGSPSNVIEAEPRGEDDDRIEQDIPSPKRQRLSSSNRNAPSRVAIPRPSPSDLQAISEAIEAEERKRAQAVARQAAEAGETEWVLDFPGVSTPTLNVSTETRPFIVDAGLLDMGDAELDFGRRSYGNFKRMKKSTETRAVEDDAPNSNFESGEDQEDEIMNPADPAQVEAMIERAKLRAENKRRKQRKMEEEELAKKKVRLSKLTSISAGGGISSGARNRISAGGGGGSGGGIGGKWKGRR